jgi:hypothetical protein
MAIFAPRPGKGKDFIPCPEGFHRAVCCDVWMKADVLTKFGKKDKVYLLFQVDELSAGLTKIELEDGSTKQVPFSTMYPANLSVHEKATLRKTIEIWRGRKFTSDDEAAGFDFEKLVGQNCQVQVQHSNPVGEEKRIYANITALVPANPGLPGLTVRDYIRRKDREDGTDGSHDIDNDDLPF